MADIRRAGLLRSKASVIDLQASEVRDHGRSTPQGDVAGACCCSNEVRLVLEVCDQEGVMVIHQKLASGDGNIAFVPATFISI